MIKRIKRLYSRRKAVSPVIATILLIALTVAAATIIYFVIVPLFNTYKLDASVVTIHDTDKDSLYNQVEIQFVNSGTKNINITQVIIWTSAQTEIANSDLWLAHEGWTFDVPTESLIQPSEVDSVKLSGTSQIGLSIYERTYFRMEIDYTGMKNALVTEWIRVSDEFLDLSDLLSGFETFNLTANGFDGTIDDPSRTANNYVTNADGDYQLDVLTIENLPVLNETQLIPFYIGQNIVVFHSPNGNLSGQPLEQKFDFASTPFRAKKLFLLGLAGSWGDNFNANSWALNLTIVYTDNSISENLLNKSYIDDWWYGSNPGNLCLASPYGLITEIDLGTQADTPH